MPSQPADQALCFCQWCGSNLSMRLFGRLAAFEDIVQPGPWLLFIELGHHRPEVSFRMRSETGTLRPGLAVVQAPVTAARPLGRLA